MATPALVETGPTKAAPRLRLLAKIDREPPWRALIAGVAIGGVSGLLLLLGGPWVGLAGTIALLGGATWLAFWGEPIGVEIFADEEAARPTPEPAAPTPQREEPSPPPAVPPPRELIAMVDIPGGSFLMGSPPEEEGRYSDEGPQHRVAISPFQMATTPVTQRLYREIVGKTPGDPAGDDLPVNNVSWVEAIQFCNRLSERAGLRPYYTEGGEVAWQDHGADGYRLPTEAEWEYAARAGTTTRYFFGDDANSLGEYAWFSKNSEGQVHPVGRLKPNAWGLYDVYGNVWEWCGDRFGIYTAEEQVDPAGPSSGDSRVLRGGSFGDVPRGLRSANRVRFPPEFRVKDVGFRCVRGARRQR